MDLWLPLDPEDLPGLWLLQVPEGLSGLFLPLDLEVLPGPVHQLLQLPLEVLQVLVLPWDR